ncbi:MAG TPA: hypothetical protein VGG19_09540, partial [Tepidisphaeraceae bacterium]|jgi:hypothetical protein
VVVCALAVCVVAIVLEITGNNGALPNKNFFTTDDGKTWFADSASKLPPFDHNGAQAVRCYVFKGKNGEFAGLLQKYDDTNRAELARRGDKLPPRDMPSLVKKPGDKEWTSVGPDQEALMLAHVSPPDGSNSDIEIVMP